MPSQEPIIQRKDLEEKIAKEKEELANYQARMEIKQLQATLKLLKKEKEGTLPGSQLDLDNNAFRGDYLDDQVLQKPQVLNLVQAENKLNDVLGNKKCLSLLETMGLARPKTGDQPASITHKTPDKPIRKVIQSPEKDVTKKLLEVIQVM